MEPKDSLYVHKNIPLVPLLSQMNPDHTEICSLRSMLILISHVPLHLKSGLFTSGFTTKILLCIFHTMNYLFATKVIYVSVQYSPANYRFYVKELNI